MSSSPTVSFPITLALGGINREMEAPEEAMSSNSNSEATGDSGDASASIVVIKGKRTKRQRVHPPAPAASPAAPDSCSASEAASGIVTDEEDDMAANCLMLLAQGRRAVHAEHMIMPRESVTEEGGRAQGTSTEKFTSRRFTETATTTDGKIGFYVYECKTCNKCFSSFQALGGHRASHTKPRLALAPAGATTTAGDKIDMAGDHMLISMSSLARQTPDTRPKVHECSICGTEFNSGQALGGHMRRHRPLVYNVEGGVRKERSLLSLDLNLPAPTGDELRIQRPSSPAPEFSLNSKPPLFLPSGHGELPLLR